MIDATNGREIIEMGANVGPAHNFTVIGIARTGVPGVNVFVGRDLKTGEYVVSRYEDGASCWFNGFYVSPSGDSKRDRERALNNFISKIDPELVVFTP